MRTALTVAVIVALGLVALLAMRRGWQRRASRSGAVVPELFPLPDDAALGGPRTAPVEAVYVSSTTAGDWLDRVVAHDLGARSNAVVQVFDAGVRVLREGARDLFIPADRVRGVRTEGGMAGKFVGGDGLVVVTWQAPDPAAALLDTGFRTRRAADRAPLIDAVGALTADSAETDPADVHQTRTGEPGATKEQQQ
ncbi:hypothetical protein [Cellulomonas fimi]|uniref:PH-like domain-containing protein n=1 Tax=Cellulomonas fimi TaxID=1708 RepID=UPI0020129176|nr:hypothetical protein [Cellulomonas fimi]